MKKERAYEVMRRILKDNDTNTRVPKSTTRGRYSLKIYFSEVTESNKAEVIKKILKILGKRKKDPENNIERLRQLKEDVEKERDKNSTATILFISRTNYREIKRIAKQYHLEMEIRRYRGGSEKTKRVKY